MKEQLFIENLMGFGLTRQEASIYHCLMLEKKLTGYEVSKLTGISRSNAYGALASLVEKGAAYVMEEQAKRYIAVDVTEFCANYINALEGKARWFRLHMPEKKMEGSGYLTIEGKDHIQNKIHNLLTKAKERMYLSATYDTIVELETEIAQLAKDGKKVVILTDRAYKEPRIRTYHTSEKGCQFSLITDSKTVLTGEYGKKSKNICICSGEENFVEVFKNALSNEIKLLDMKIGE